jgi:hypothetical protein
MVYFTTPQHLTLQLQHLLHANSSCLPQCASTAAEATIHMPYITHFTTAAWQHPPQHYQLLLLFSSSLATAILPCQQQRQ